MGTTANATAVTVNPDVLDHPFDVFDGGFTIATPTLEDLSNYLELMGVPIDAPGIAATRCLDFAIPTYEPEFINTDLQMANFADDGNAVAGTRWRALSPILV